MQSAGSLNVTKATHQSLAPRVTHMALKPGGEFTDAKEAGEPARLLLRILSSPLPASLQECACRSSNTLIATNYLKS